MKSIKVKVTFIEEVLGMASSDPNLHDNFIAKNAPDAPKREEEIAAIGVDEAVRLGTTVFPRNAKGVPCFWDYQIKGMFKDSVGMLRKVEGTACSKIKAYKKEIDGLIFIAPRMIPINAAGEMGTCQRSLRASTPQGERISLASSETLPAGSTIEFEITLLVDSDEKWVIECLDYMKLRGLGQWRNSGKGRAVYEIIK